MLDHSLRILTIALIVVPACVVLQGVVLRYSGNSLVWCDQIAAVLLARIMFSGTAFAVLRNAHLGSLNAALSIHDRATSFPLIAIQFFILAGALMNTGGISTRPWRHFRRSRHGDGGRGARGGDGAVRRGLHPSRDRPETSLRVCAAIFDGVLKTSTVMLLAATSAVPGLHLTETEMPQRRAAGTAGITTDRIAVLMIINVFPPFAGKVLHGAAAIILTVPIVMPPARQPGIDPVGFGILPTLNIALGQQAPPVASVLVTACSITKTDLWGDPDEPAFHRCAGPRAAPGHACPGDPALAGRSVLKTGLKAALPRIWPEAID